MNISNYFEELGSAYHAELEDLQTDSEGKNVFAARLKEKRSQFSALMPMIEFAPEMVAPAFHGGIRFTNPHAMTMLSANEPDEFPEWGWLEDAVQFEPWAAELAVIALREAGGEQFMSTVLGLAFLHDRETPQSKSPSADSDADDDADDAIEGAHEKEAHDIDIDDDERDLEEAGASWMEEQGFERRE